MATISWVRYEFNIPEQLSEETYNILKYNFMHTQGYAPFPKGGFFKTFRISSIIFGISAFVQTFWAIHIDVFDNIAGIGLFLMIGCLLSGIMFSWASFLQFMMDRHSYYSSLKKKIISSTNYSDFLKR
jgi:hypothetical protein